jgi:CRP-like cAMP-binding protein
MDSGSMFMEELVLFDKPSPVVFKTITNCVLIKIDKCAMKRVMKQDIDVVLDICESIASKFLVAMDYIRFEPRSSAENKICKLLLMFASHDGVHTDDGKIVCNRKVSQQMIADILGMNRVTVSRKIKEFKDNNLILSIDTGDGKRYVFDIDEMEKYLSELES